MAALSSSLRTPATVAVQDGFLVSTGEYVGVYSSALQRRLIDNTSVFPSVTPDSWRNVSLVNSSVLRYLELEGNYLADVPLQLPSLFVLKLNGSLSDAANLTSNAPGGAWPRFTGLVTLNDTTFTAVEGGTYNATVHNATAVQAIGVLNSFHTTVRSVRANSQYASAIGINGGSANEITRCECGGDAARMSPTRGIWTLATEQACVRACAVCVNRGCLFRLRAVVSSCMYTTYPPFICMWNLTTS